jgi:hypothetical protein
VRANGCSIGGTVSPSQKTGCTAMSPLAAQ